MKFKKFLPNTPCQIGWIVALAVVWFLSGCSSGPSSTSFVEHGVEVTLTLLETEAGSEIQANFAPTEPLFHLYSIDMDEKGIDGVGRPTKVEIVSDFAQISGPVIADQPVIDTEFEGFSAPFPLYPDGPVTLSIPVSFSDGSAEQPLDLAISYIACSNEGICKPLVKNYQVTLNR